MPCLRDRSNAYVPKAMQLPCNRAGRCGKMVRSITLRRTRARSRSRQRSRLRSRLPAEDEGVVHFHRLARRLEAGVGRVVEGGADAQVDVALVEGREDLDGVLAVTLEDDLHPRRALLGVVLLVALVDALLHRRQRRGALFAAEPVAE